MWSSLFFKIKYIVTQAIQIKELQLSHSTTHTSIFTNVTIISLCTLESFIMARNPFVFNCFKVLSQLKSKIVQMKEQWTMKIWRENECRTYTSSKSRNFLSKFWSFPLAVLKATILRLYCLNNTHTEGIIR